ncbi:tRNA (cytidine(34)-2'-O)-methyltransferase [Oceanibaculum sp.]|uniref:tRNA (cytidine(34)-2'-O)-methyltransferase n=1 Tax=Oceanibaculum sp. TaxID=1903597 RepID=UPI0025852F6E|nr:tRNA (cytidine(34)-2'-O)-methyltransferase [Oceanibaculum sp.]MCH2395299.1 tRNA (cytidine(34)-2'-O)-methyltransferase [Oceanibaculum sp.]
MHLALFQPDIPQNAGAIMRLGACLGVPVDLIEPAGFILDDRRMRRAGMDYIDRLTLIRHASWERFQADRAPGRLVLLTTKAATPYTGFDFRPDDILILGRESSGVPDHVHEAADARLLIPLLPGLRSINVAQAAAMVLGEALRQTGGFPAAQTLANQAGG